MAKTQSLKAEDRKRTGTGLLKRMRREGFVPSVVYGGGSENRNVKVKAKEFRDLLAHSASANIHHAAGAEAVENDICYRKRRGVGIVQCRE